MSRPQLRVIANAAALTDLEARLADLLATFFVRECADLGDERQALDAILRIPNESLPRRRLTDPVFDAALEKARAIRQGRI